MVKIVDAKGKICPMPIILTKKAIDASSDGDVIEVWLDNVTARCNLTQYVSELGIPYNEIVSNSEYTIRFTVNSKPLAKGVEGVLCPILTKELGDYVIVINGDTMGRGDEELGKSLMRTYINTLLELEDFPKTIIFYNSGVKLLHQGADTVESIEKLQQDGVDILCCGVCLDYYNIELAVGRVGNMFKIGNIVASATKIIYP